MTVDGGPHAIEKSEDNESTFDPGSLQAEPGDGHLDPNDLHVDADEADLPAGLAGPPVPPPPTAPEPNPHLDAAREVFLSGAKQGLSHLLEGAEKSNDPAGLLWQISDLATQMRTMASITDTVGTPPTEGINPSSEEAAEHFIDGAHSALHALLVGFDTDNAMASLKQIQMFASQAAEVAEGEGRERGRNKTLKAMLQSLPISLRAKRKILKILVHQGVNLEGGPPGIPGPNVVSSIGSPALWHGVDFGNDSDDSDDYGNSMGTLTTPEGLEIPVNPNGEFPGSDRETQGVRMLTELIAGIVGLSTGKALEGDIKAYRAAIDAGLEEEATRIKARIDDRIAGRTPGFEARTAAEALINTIGGMTPDQAEAGGPSYGVVPSIPVG